MSNVLTDEEKEARRRKVEEIRRKMSEKGTLSSSPSRTNPDHPSPHSNNDAPAAAPISPVKPAIVAADDVPSKNGTANGDIHLDLDVDVDDVERILEKAARLLRDEEDRKRRGSISTPSPSSSPHSSNPSSARQTVVASDAPAAVPQTPASKSAVPVLAAKEEKDPHLGEERKKKTKKKKKKDAHAKGENGKGEEKKRKKKKEKKEKKAKKETAVVDGVVVESEPTLGEMNGTAAVGAVDTDKESRASVCGEESGGEEKNDVVLVVVAKEEEKKEDEEKPKEKDPAVEPSVRQEEVDRPPSPPSSSPSPPQVTVTAVEETKATSEETLLASADGSEHSTIDDDNVDDSDLEVSGVNAGTPMSMSTDDSSPVPSPSSSLSTEAEAEAEADPSPKSSPSVAKSVAAARQRPAGWTKGSFVGASQAADHSRRARNHGHSSASPHGSPGARNRLMLGTRSEHSSPLSSSVPAASPLAAAAATLKLYRSSGEVDRSGSDDEDDRGRKLQAMKERKSACYSMQLPPTTTTTTSSSSNSSSSGISSTGTSGGGSEVSQAINASLARKWGAARRSGPVHTSYQDLMRLRSASVAYNPELFPGSGVQPISVSGSHMMTNKNDEYVVKFVYSNELYKIVCSCEMNGSQIKAAMIQHVKSLLALPDSDVPPAGDKDKGKGKDDASESEGETSSSSTSPRTSISDASSLEEKDYVLKIPGVNYYLVKEEQSLHLVGVLQVCKKSFVSFPLEMIPRPSTDVLHENDKLNVKEKIMSELNANTEVFELLSNPISGDNPLLHILKSDNDEINSFRKRITKVRRGVLKEREAAVRKASKANSNSKYDTSFLPQYRESEPLPLNLPNTFIILAYQPADEKDEVQTSTQTFNATRDQTVDELKAKMFRKYKGTHPLATGTEDDYIVKVTGYKEYLIGSHKILSYDYIRKCLSKKVTPVLSLVPLKEVDLMIPEPVEDSVVDMILSREKDMQMSKERYREQEARKPVSEMVQQLRVKINGVDNVDTFIKEQKGKKEHKGGSGIDTQSDKEGGKKKTYCLYVCSQIYHGDELIAEDMYTNAILYSNGPLWNEWLVSSVKLRDIPRGARMCFTLYRRQLDNTVSAEAVFTEKGKFNEKTDVPLGWVNCQFIDHKDQLRQGLCSFKLWHGKPNPIGTCVENVAVKDKERATTLHVEFQIHRTIVYFPPPPDLDSLRAADTAAINKRASGGSDSSEIVAKRKIIKLQVEEIMKKDPLTPLGEDERQLLWECREYCAQFPALLPRFLQYVKWNDMHCVTEAYHMLALWALPTPFEALSLLDAKYASPVVRAYAVERLHELDDRALSDFLLQLTQVLKYEAYHYSPLAEFLLSRALMNVNQIGHAFFWLLKSELHNPTIASRYSLLAEAYLRGCGAHRQELVKQNKVLNQLAKVALRVKEAPSSEKKRVLEEGLKRVEFPAKFQLPLDPRQEVKGLIIEKCKYMDSKKLPLWLVFDNAEKRGAPIRVIFKAGDDLRQDVLTLQMLRIMDKLWKEEGLDLRLNPYGCVATGDELGMIEVVLNASTTASVNKERGGSKAVLYKDTLTSWLREKNPSAEKFEAAEENFMLSCAGYCVATYVLGIGDRHNDNIMITEFGHLFHIDFGHFLGNVKSKLGIKRERAPFIFNPQFAHVLGGSKGRRYAQYVETCQRAYNIVRKHAHMLINLFMMMLSTGIPELQCEEDILYLCGSLLVGVDEKSAAENFAKLIEEARKTKSVLVNDIVHIWAHSKK